MIQIAKGSGLCFFQNEVYPSHRPPCALARIGTEKEAEICRTQYPRHLLKALIHSMHICVPITHISTQDTQVSIHELCIYHYASRLPKIS